MIRQRLAHAIYNVAERINPPPAAAPGMWAVKLRVA